MKVLNGVFVFLSAIVVSAAAHAYEEPGIGVPALPGILVCECTCAGQQVTFPSTYTDCSAVNSANPPVACSYTNSGGGTVNGTLSSCSSKWVKK